MVIHYRDDEMIFVQAHSDRVTVIFSTFFKEEMDQVFGKVFLQEFVDARRDPSVQNAPQVLYTNREPPLEIRDIPGVQSHDNIGYVTFGKRPCKSGTDALASHELPPLQGRRNT